MALSTKRIRLGTTVTPLSRRRPWKLARETVTLDHLSNGRLILGVGVGDVTDRGFAQVGEVTNTRQRAQMLDEALEVLVGLWSGEPFRYQGTFYQVQEVTFLPRPVQVPRIPIWVGGNWPHPGVIRRAARFDGFCGGKVYAAGEAWLLTSAEVQTLKATIEQQRRVAGPYDIALGGAERGPDWEQERATIKALAQAGATWWMEWVAPCGQEELRSRIKQGPLRIE
jgi:alkanesulfonate monooxygenase SsuD/methylene tetrahydromethanopterin reductase-like flavin-dependent oxidoreductase (luciferase family)